MFHVQYHKLLRKHNAYNTVNLRLMYNWLYTIASDIFISYFVSYIVQTHLLLVYCITFTMYSDLLAQSIILIKILTVMEPYWYKNHNVHIRIPDMRLLICTFMGRIVLPVSKTARW